MPLAVLVGESWVEGSAPVFAVPNDGTLDTLVIYVSPLIL